MWESMGLPDVPEEHLELLTKNLKDIPPMELKYLNQHIKSVGHKYPWSVKPKYVLFGLIATVVSGLVAVVVALVKLRGASWSIKTLSSLIPGAPALLNPKPKPRTVRFRKVPTEEVRIEEEPSAPTETEAIAVETQPPPYAPEPEARKARTLPQTSHPAPDHERPLDRPMKAYPMLKMALPPTDITLQHLRRAQDELLEPQEIRRYQHYLAKKMTQ